MKCSNPYFSANDEDAHCGPLSEMTTSGMPCLAKIDFNHDHGIRRRFFQQRYLNVPREVVHDKYILLVFSLE